MVYRLSSEEALGTEKSQRGVSDVNLNVDATVRSEFFPPKGPIRASEFGLHNTNLKQLRD